MKKKHVKIGVWVLSAALALQLPAGSVIEAQTENTDGVTEEMTENQTETSVYTDTGAPAEETAAALEEVVPAAEETAEAEEAVPAEEETASAAEETVEAIEAALAEETQEEQGWQARVFFPDWKGYTDDTLAMNSMFSFFGYHGQGYIQIRVSEEVESFRLYINGRPLYTSGYGPGETAVIDISGHTLDGTNTLQVSNIVPAGLSRAVVVDIPYPEILPGTPEEEGIQPQTLSLISDLIETDIENGFTSAQLAVVKNGRLVCENAWGLTNSCLPDGTRCTDSAPVTTDTLYDLASLTKMFSVNYALQKLVTDGAVDLDARIVDFLGAEFATETILLPDDEDNPAKNAEASLGTIKAWKARLTIRDLLRHQGGFPAGARYCAPLLYKEDLEEGETCRVLVPSSVWPEISMTAVSPGPYPEVYRGRPLI